MSYLEYVRGDHEAGVSHIPGDKEGFVDVRNLKLPPDDHRTIRTVGELARMQPEIAASSTTERIQPPVGKSPNSSAERFVPVISSEGFRSSYAIACIGGVAVSAEAEHILAATEVNPQPDQRNLVHAGVGAVSQ